MTLTKRLNDFTNTFRFAFKSSQNFKVLYNKVISHFTTKKEIKANEENLSWIKSKCTDYISLANAISPMLCKESLEFSEKLVARSQKILQQAPKLGGGGISPFLYFITRLTHPLCIVETGVAAGFTSQTFLSAIKKNGSGFLFSSDFPYFRIAEPEKFIGILVEEDLKKFWELHIKGDKINLPHILSKVDKINIFHYDSDKTYDGRTFATNLVENKMSEDSILIYDDIQDNTHFKDFILTTKPEEWYIFEFEKKYVGVIGNLSKYKI